MTIITTTERAQAQADVAALIAASGLTATLLRRSGPESRYGEEDSAYADTGVTFPFELRAKPKDPAPALVRRAARGPARPRTGAAPEPRVTSYGL